MYTVILTADRPLAGKGGEWMATIKELAAYTGLSPSTVSIVLGGKAEERGIPQATCQRVLEAARVLG